MHRIKRLGVLVLTAFFALPTLPQETDTTAKPAILVPASSDEVTTVVHFSGVDKPRFEDIALGALVNDQKPNQHIIPKLTNPAPTDPKLKIDRTKKDWDVPITVGNLIPFGESTVPLLLNRQPNQTLHFYKAGLVAKPTAESGFAVREGNQLLIVLENPTAFDYSKVRARLRFQDVEVCQAKADKSQGGCSGDKNCDDPANWVWFPVLKHSPVTLRVPPAPEWFRDPQTSFPKSAKRKGVLTLQFVGAVTPAAAAVPATPTKVPATSRKGTTTPAKDQPNPGKGPDTPGVGSPPSPDSAPPVYEQDIPIEVQFDPSETTTFWNLVRVGFWLVAGALLALLLRVTIPNYRRKSVLKGQLGDAAKATRAISDDIKSMLRVLLRVERLNLDQLCRSAWISGPSFQERAQLIEQGLATLSRKIEFTRRLDTSRGRKAILLDQDVPPTRIAAIDRELESAADTLMRDQLVEQDWVFIQQRLEAADKLLHEPTQDEKDAFQALLVQRWKAVRDFFGTVSAEDLRLKVPDALQGMDSAFPAKECLPKKDDDGSQWVATAGSMRIDLQLGALEILRDYLFLAPAVTPATTTDPQSRWSTSKESMKKLCETPTVENLDTARLLIRELAEDIDAGRVIEALRKGEAAIEMSPQTAQLNEKVRYSLRFKDPFLNTATARRFILCEWTFEAQPDQPSSPEKAAKRPGTAPELSERGWEIYHYFAESVKQCSLVVRFFYKGELVKKQSAEGQPAPTLEYTRTIRPQAKPRKFRDGWWVLRSERVFPEALQLGAALLVPLATLAITQAGQGSSGSWWELLGVGFGSETIRAILTGKTEQGAVPAQTARQP
jgi:hypothetical protein